LFHEWADSTLIAIHQVLVIIEIEKQSLESISPVLSQDAWNCGYILGPRRVQISELKAQRTETASKTSLSTATSIQLTSTLVSSCNGLEVIHEPVHSPINGLDLKREQSISLQSLISNLLQTQLFPSSKDTPMSISNVISMGSKMEAETEPVAAKIGNETKEK
jgi:hypothetical protein